MHTACVWSEKLPFAGYSVVKELGSASGFGARWLSGLIVASVEFISPGLKRKASSLEPKVGGEYRARTGDLLVANQALSQLS